MAEETHPKVHTYDIPRVGCCFTRMLKPDGSSTRMYYRDGQPIIGSITKLDGDEWYVLVGWTQPDGEGKPLKLNTQKGPFATMEVAEDWMDAVGIGAVAGSGQKFEYLQMVEHTGAERAGNPPAVIDEATGALKEGK